MPPTRRSFGRTPVRTPASLAEHFRRSGYAADARYALLPERRPAPELHRSVFIVMTRLRRLAALFALPLLFVVALWAPIPKVGDPGIEHVVAQVHARMPGWDVVGATDTWEGGYAVAASCGTEEMGFQVVPGHGLPPNDAWLQPNDDATRIWLEQISDYPTFLIWRAHPQTDRTLSCDRELAQVETGRARNQLSARNASVIGGSNADLESARHRRVD
jgi:hypothetical protein